MSKRAFMLLAAVILGCTVLAWPAQALAEQHFYQGNHRYPSYGVKAAISTPSTNETVNDYFVANFVSNIYETTMGAEVWLQTGWIDGDGNTWCWDWSWLIPTEPTSYREYNGTSTYDFDLYSTQSPGMSRQYVVVNEGGIYSPYWTAKIGTVSRGTYNCYSASCEVEALSEVLDDGSPSTNHCRATFTSVYYKGTSTYFLFDQDYYWPAYGSWFTTSHAPNVYHTYSTSCN